jgi:GNAT superfamily N-acetyltransferase
VALARDLRDGEALSENRPSMPKLRPATRADAAALRMLGLEVFLETYAPAGVRNGLAREAEETFSAAQVARWLADPDDVVLVADVEGGLAGFAHVTLGAGRELFEGEVPAELQRLYVRRPFLGQGLGRALLLCAEDVAAVHGASVLWLAAWAGNARALAFYARQGYSDIGAAEHVFEGRRFENRRFAKPLGVSAPAAFG